MPAWEAHGEGIEFLDGEGPADTPILLSRRHHEAHAVFASKDAPPHGTRGLDRAAFHVKEGSDFLNNVPVLGSDDLGNSLVNVFRHRAIVLGVPRARSQHLDLLDQLPQPAFVIDPYMGIAVHQSPALLLRPGLVIVVEGEPLLRPGT